MAAAAVPWRRVLLVLVAFYAGPSVHGLAVARHARGPAAAGGGRTPGQKDMPSLDDDVLSDLDTRWQPKLPTSPSEARLTVVQITDVYTLAHFSSVKTMLQETRQCLQEKCGFPGDKSVISVLTGDFLAPYLLSSVDRGNGMMNAISKTPIDYLTWGNHEADVDHRTVCTHVKKYAENGGIWLNTNMQDHAAMEYQKPFEIVEVCSPDGCNKRRIGLVAVLSEDPALYAQFKAPGAFGGATIRDPWETLREYKELLEGPEYNCDVVLPLQHTYVPDDHRTCREFDFPVLLSGHDHHRVDEVIDGTRLLKPGLDAVYATVLEMSWPDDASPPRPNIKARFVECDQWEPDEELEEENDRAYDALLPLRNTELARVPPTFEPLSSVNSRGAVTTMGVFICSLIRSAMNAARRQRQHQVDAVLIMGGNIRGGTDYEEGSFFSLEALEAEIKPDETIAVVPMPGWLVAEGIAATHAGDPIPGWFQYDSGITEEFDGSGTPVVTHVAGEPIDPDRIYRVATKVGDLTNGQSPPLTEYFTAHPEALPPKGAYVNVHAELLSFFARNLWRKIWEEITPRPLRNNNEEEAIEDDENDFSPPLDVLCDSALSDCQPERRLAALDSDETGIITIDEIHYALRDIVGLSVDDNERSLAQFVHSFADTDNDGKVTINDFQTFCYEMPMMYENQKWRLAYPRSPKTAARSSKVVDGSSVQ